MNQNPLEKGPERILTKEEVMKVMSRFLENPVLTRELFNAQGLYLLEVQVKGKEHTNMVISPIFGDSPANI